MHMFAPFWYDNYSAMNTRCLIGPVIPATKHERKKGRVAWFFSTKAVCIGKAIIVTLNKKGPMESWASWSDWHICDWQNTKDIIVRLLWDAKTCMGLLVRFNGGTAKIKTSTSRQCYEEKHVIKSARKQQSMREKFMQELRIAGSSPKWRIMETFFINVGYS
ncbi:hypothetical protein L1987_52471 [Smallanthus sonchifolius]|uniref:Uncharacterized protein n=1 Tax=Smallanthus sonchifolius TaxID=185202 RepID=A0ACB9ETY9_9ASTR|nr:hypothetical protein L1987_52471 [Smallanthus sonchifolius]